MFARKSESQNYFEAKRTFDADGTAMQVDAFQKGGPKGGGGGGGTGDGKCFNCGEQGHIGAYCPKPKIQANTTRMSWWEFAAKAGNNGTRGQRRRRRDIMAKERDSRECATTVWDLGIRRGNAQTYLRAKAREV